MKYRILIVDDEKEIRDMLSRHFRLKGYSCSTAEGVDAAEGVLQSELVHIVISDIVMPGKSGTELMKLINEEYPMVKIIMITGYVSLENALTCMRRGADTCIFKPLGDLTELDEAVHRAGAWHSRWLEKLHILKDNRRGHE
ncbi:response regulator [Chitinivibrio alkaliphilus]|uniref:Signal receiver domain-containing protein n=1 Tax=Chitinivibrio alkaliphilus ACht1 TaxID=1313304 RepID=U7D5K7_9BACT|nr:response regulator [Chitinivibrio alkaliphilus]ERP31253.1 signal receiver domain-containing protein [Chitinivibrio alkaliphilus ACht1]